MNYKETYENYHNIKIQKDFDIHHIDGNVDNNNIENLICLPKKFHQCLHNWVGIISREPICVLLDWYNYMIEKEYKFTHRALGYYLAVKYKKLVKPTAKIERKRRKYLKDLKTNQRYNLSEKTKVYDLSVSGRNIYDEKTQHINWVGESKK